MIPIRTWGTATVIEFRDEDAAGPDLAFDPFGNAIAVWLQRDENAQRIWANRYVPASGWADPEPISPDTSTAAGAKIGFDANGNAMVVWRRYLAGLFGAWANRYDATSGWGTAEAIGAQETSLGDLELALAVSPNGDAISVWHQSDGTRRNVWGNNYTPLGGWGTAQLIENEDGGDATDPDTAMDASGNGIAVWTQSDGASFNPTANRYEAGSGWTVAESISGGSPGSLDPKVAVYPEGNGIAVWGGPGVHGNRYTPSGGWGTAEEVSSAPQSTQAPAIDVSSNGGNAIAVWPHFDGTRTNVWANRYVPGTGWAAAEMIETNDEGGTQWVDIAVDPDGNAVAVWEHSDGSRKNIWANYYTADLGWATAVNIDDEDLGDAERPQVAVDSDGHAIAVWYQDDGTRINVWANRLE